LTEKLMSRRMTWPQICRTGQFKGLWVALDNCRYDPSTMKPLEGDVVDADSELGSLCSRMRETGQSSCTVLFCEGEVFVERPVPVPEGPTGASARSH
jgi:hypothetical protein